MDVMQSTSNKTSIHKKFDDFLVSKDLKLTQPRKKILDIIISIKDHFTAEELLDHSKVIQSRVSKATLYRTLSLLLESQLIEEHDFGEGMKYYELSPDQSHHDHIVCLDCKKIFEFHNEEIEQLQEKEAKKFHIKLNSHSHKLYGHCTKKNCSNMSDLEE